MSRDNAALEPEPGDNFESTDSLDRLLGSMSGPSTSMDHQMDTKLDAQMLEDWLNKNKNQDVNARPFVEIIEQPKQKELRFRYECEGRSAGSLPGVKSDLDRKTYPTIKVHNYQGPVRVLASLVTRQDPPRPHPHGLVGKDCKHGVCGMTVQETDKMHISFPNLGIQCVKQKEIIDALKLKKSMGIDPFQWFVTSKVNLDKVKPKSLDYEMNVVCICFQVFIPDPQNPSQFTRPLPPVVTHPIFDKKGATLHIARCDKNHGSVKGGDEIFILCDKIQRDDVAVIFYCDKLQWQAQASFGPNDIHRQVAIVCKTPKFKDLKIDKPVHVQFLLRRPSDMEQSDPVDFTYVPFDEDSSQIGAKRKRKSTNFQNYFKGNVDTNVKVESLNEDQPSCSYSSPAYRGPAAPAAMPAPPIVVPPAQPSQAMDVKRLLRGKIINKPSTNSGYEIRTPPKDHTPPGQSTRRGRRPGSGRSTSKMAAQFNQATSSSTPFVDPTGQVNIAVAPGLSTVNAGLFSNATTYAQMTNVPMNTSAADPTAAQLFNSMQEGAAAANEELPSEAERAVENLLAGMQGPSVETVANPSSVIELNSAGNWQLDGVEIPAHLAEEISTVAAQLMQNTQSGDLDRFDLNQLQDDTEILISDPNSPAEMMVEEGVADSVSIPYSNSVELGAQPPHTTGYLQQESNK